MSVHRRPRPAAALAVAAALATGSLVAAARDAAADGFWEREKLLDDGFGSRPWLDDRGVEIAAAWSTMLWSNVYGGRRTGTELDGFLDLTILVDLEDLVHWRGLHFTLGWDWYVGGQPTISLVGGSPGLAVSYYEASNAFRFYEISLRQDLDDDGLWSVKFGQLAADDTFMLSTYAALFLNGGFGAFGTLSLDTLLPVYPLAAPGAFARGSLLGHGQVRLGAYAADTGADRTSNWGFGWRFGGDAPLAVIGELELDERLDGRPTALTLGGYAILGDVPGVEPGTVLRHNGNVYAMLDHALALDGNGNTRIGMFARVSASPWPDRNTSTWYADAGIEFAGPFASRPRDLVGAAVGLIVFGEEFRRRNEAVPTAQTAVEFTYQAAITPWLTIQPDLQLQFDPPYNRRTATVVGLQTVVVF